ncbi:SUMO-specific isopeptidase USPL1 [Megalops cyprinoides]|uniref:SUMO-specific isopeptidase USPL1 n=1 Tax=Megalops cyprinoides TaxID=118141 RepID=UPI001863B974|nr:SUMO-specific isopeptidase USPL1 [Megalops cyprinoides]XP_036380851.1 SUMO-specific isopeptidase USPL1 [Megalops cyprinoides]XP_036380852.1 SUMO-specific isopeptidase USPL1 [Megalops cyprinoides]
MSGEDTDSGVPTPLAGYLGKTAERASLVENCPCCAANGQIYTLRSYRINFQESITLCTNPQCLFPFLNNPLEEIFNSITTGESKANGKEKSPCSPCEGHPVPVLKCQKTGDVECANSLVCSPSSVDQSHNGLSQQALSLRDNDDSQESDSPSLPNNVEHTGSTKKPDEAGSETRELSFPKIEVRPVVEQEVGPSVEREAESSLEQDVRLKVEQEAESSADQAVRLIVAQQEEPSVEQEEEPAVEQEVRLKVEQEAEPAAVQEVGLIVEQEEGSSAMQEVRLKVEQEEGESAEQEVRHEVEQEAEPTAVQEVRLIVEQEVRLKVEQEEWSSAVQEVRLKVEQEEEESAEQEVRHEVEQEVEPTAVQEVRLIVEQGEEPSVANEVRQKVEQEAESSAEQEVRMLVEHQGGLVELVASPSHLFWRNEHNLCWLDTLLVALLHCRTLMEHAASLPGDRSPVQKLCDRYNKACDVMKANEQIDVEDGAVKVPSDILHQAEREMEDLRMSSFKLLEPKLHCKLGERETPVFALPLFLRLDPRAEDLFQHAFHWDFECAACGHTFNNRCEKTLTTFTQVVPDWHPLHAVHRAQCSRCHHKQQRRKMLLERVSPVFALHFVEGLPQNDVTVYSFDFQGNHHVVSTVIQYDKHLKHFVTWVRDASGSWLEFDDLKYPRCIAHKCLPVPADQIHVVFWEVQATREEMRPGGHALNEAPMERDITSAGAQQHDLSLPFPQDNTYILNALTEEDVNGGTGMASATNLDASIGTTTLLDAFEGLSHSDIITLTLVEVKVDGEGRPLDSCGSVAVSQPVSADTGLSAAVEASSVQCAAADSSAQSPPECIREQSTGSRPGLTRKRKAPSDEEIVMPSVIMPPAADLPCVDTAVPASSGTAPVPGVHDCSAVSNARWSNLLSRHPSLQSTPIPPKRVATAPSQRPALKLADEKVLPAKAAEMFGGFKPRGSVIQTEWSSKGNQQHHPTDSRTQNTVFKQPLIEARSPQPSALHSQKSLSRVGGPLGATVTAKSQTAVPLDSTGALRHKLLKKLKAKKRKLAALDQLLGKGKAEALQRPDSTEITSPYTVSSTTSLCNSPSYDQFFTDLLSPSTTASNLSPDSTGLLMLASGQEGAEAVGESISAAQPEGIGSVVSQPTGNGLGSIKDDFLEEFMSGTELQPCATENADFNVFDMFF